ncbi:MAG TPA: hypothetical protein VGZ72_15070 [Stellaceae bacterium]|jgi:hypothetical protein|nr:hypothetical protein [Stellaceae bacterium]
MGDDSNRNRIKDLIHRQGMPPAPAAAPLVTEVRTDGGMILHRPPKKRGFSIGPILIEWTYGVPLDQVEKFNIFLDKNEEFIAACCEELMEGVSYRGTFLTAGFGDVRYKTFWSYASPEAMEEWGSVLKKRSKFVTVLAQLRSYWTRDPGRAEMRYQEAAQLTDLDANAAEKPFLQLTLAATKVKPR